MCGRDKGSRERSNGAGQENANGRREATAKGKGQGEATGQRVKVVILYCKPKIDLGNLPVGLASTPGLPQASSRSSLRICNRTFFTISNCVCHFC